MVLVSKICAAILLAGLRLLAGLLPLKVYRKLDKWGRQGEDDTKASPGNNNNNNQRRKRIDLLLSVFLCFGAGLLLSTCFIHMIPEVRESFDTASKTGHWPALEKFPFAEGVVCLGFFAVYFFEELGEKLMVKKSKAPDNKSANKKTVEDLQLHQRPNGECGVTDETSRSRSSSESNHPLDKRTSVEDGHHHHHHGHSHGPPITDLQQQKSVAAAIRGFLLVFALSFHSIFEGMAIGLQPTLTDVWFLFAAVTVHELAIMFCIGMEMLASQIRVVIYVAYMITLGIITPIGVAIGIVVTEYVQDPSPGHTLTIAILQGVAAGTLLYVTFLEVLERERSKHGNGLIKFLSVFLGFLLLSLLEAWGHGEQHQEPNPLNVVFQSTETTPQYSFYPPN